MFRAIIADDEQKVCELIRQLGNWDELSIEIIDCCYDGEAALVSISNHQPDLVITDIRMPIYDGLELIRRTRQDLQLDTAFVIVSGYRHFEYAHSAMQYGIVDYLLKPINQQELNETLFKICQTITGKRTTNQEKETLTRLICENQRRQNHAFIQDLLDLGLTGKLTNLTASSYGLSFPYECLQVLLLNTSLPQLHQQNTAFFTKVEEIGRRSFSFGSFLAVDHLHGIYGILNYAREQADQVSAACLFLYNSVHILTDIYGEFDLTIGIGEPVYSLSALPASLYHARTYEAAKAIVGTNRLIASLPSYFDSSAPVLFTETDGETIGRFLEILSESDMDVWIQDVQTRIQQFHYYRPICLYEAIDLCLARLTPYLAKEELLRQDMSLKRLGSTQQVLDSLFALLDHTLKDQLSYKENRDQLPVRLAKQYIHDHYAEPVTLEEIAAHVNLSPVYLSSLFKKAAGQSFMDYLTEVRIAAAKELLKRPDLTIIEISEQVGYSDNKYFRKLFKKYTGIKPSSYRKLYW